MTPTRTLVTRKQAAEALLLAGASDRAIERALGVPRKHVARLRADAGMPPWRAPAPEHGTRARARRGCDCTACTEAVAAAKAREYVASGRTRPGDDLTPERVARLDARRRESLDRTARDATVRRTRWTDDEVAIALDMSLTAEQAAIKLGRSRSGVEHQRARHAEQRTTHHGRAAAAEREMGVRPS